MLSERNEVMLFVKASSSFTVLLQFMKQDAVLTVFNLSFFGSTAFAQNDRYGLALCIKTQNFETNKNRNLSVADVLEKQLINAYFKNLCYNV